MNFSNNVLQVITDGLTYQGNLLHSFINYGLILITLAPFLMPTKRGQLRSAGWLNCFLIALAVQVFLWFAVDAVGVSLIWCMLAGYSIMLRTLHRDVLEPGQRRRLTVALISGLIGILYYASTFPPITTIAHSIAVLMGMGIFGRLRVWRTPAKPKHVVSIGKGIWGL